MQSMVVEAATTFAFLPGPPTPEAPEAADDNLGLLVPPIRSWGRPWLDADDTVTLLPATYTTSFVGFSES